VVTPDVNKKNHCMKEKQQEQKKGETQELLTSILYTLLYIIVGWGDRLYLH